MALLLGVDTGGTFTDLVLLDEATGALHTHKLPSTPEDPSLAIARGIEEVLALHGAAAAQVGFLGHGTTVATNAVIEGRLGRVGLLTTAGFRDVIELGRQRRPHLYDLDVPKPHPLATRDRRWEVGERMQYDGIPLRGVDQAQVAALAQRAAAADVEALAVVFLHSYANPDHERQARAVLRRCLPGVPVCCSSDVLPEFREYERTATTLLNAALMPVMSGYIEALRARVAALGVPITPHIMQSSGGLMGLQATAETPINTLFSGPSAGVIGALAAARRAGLADLITFDMGGTSTDVCLVEGGRPAFAHERAIGGHPLKAPTLDVHSVGAGGGSLGWVDPGGLLKVGPRSAGARPGPACYAQGGTEPTVTDANVLLGYLHPERLLGGRMPIDAARAAEAIERRLARPLGLAPVEAARGVVEIVDVNTQRAIRAISVERGRDPRQFTLVAFGGAGPLHAGRVARALGIPRVLVPPGPGVLCALGLLLADLRADFGRTAPMRADEADPARLAAIFADLEERAATWLAREGVLAGQARLTRTVEMCYLGQDYELPIPLAPGPVKVADLVRRFHAEHERAYGYAAPEAPTRLVNFRVVASAPVTAPPSAPPSPAGGDLEWAQTGERRAYFPEAGGWLACPVYQRPLLPPNRRLRGPAIVEQPDSTALVLPGQHVQADAWGNLLLEG